MGHQNQSIALAKHLGATYEIVSVSFTHKVFKLFSYVFDFFKIYTCWLFKLNTPLPKHFDLLVSAGSSTYYAAKTLSKKIGVKSVTMMLPKSYRYDFDLIFAQKHDNPPQKENIITLEANFSYVEPKGLFAPDSKSIGIIIGGDNALFKMDKARIKKQLDFIFEKFKDYKIAITSSPRTPKDIEALISEYPFDYSVIFSQNRINPIADFLHSCEIVFITMDSTSMISEAISYGQSSIEILPITTTKKNKFYTFCLNLEKNGYVHIFDTTVSKSNRKIDFKLQAIKAIV